MESDTAGNIKQCENKRESSSYKFERIQTAGVCQRYQSCSLSLSLFWAQSSSSEEKQQGLSVDKDLLSQLFKHCLVNLARMEPPVYLDSKENQG